MDISFAPPLPTHTGCRTGFSLVELMVVLAILAVVVGITLPVSSQMRRNATQTACLSNQRQIATAILLYAAENNGILPPTTHSTGSRKIENSWIYQLEPYLANVDEVRVCPAEPKARRDLMLQRKGTSYTLNDHVFDSETFNRLANLPVPSETFLVFILSENKFPGGASDHIHGENWDNWLSAVGDVEVDRHRAGARAADRLRGAANYVFADGRAASLTAAEFKSFFDHGINPAQVPLEPRNQ